jgi:hypothetical protein
MKTKLENGQKLAPQFRTVSLRTAAEGEGQRVAVDRRQPNMVMGVSVSSDEPYERYYGTEILVHTPEAVDLTRFKKKAAPLLLNHNRAQLIGKPMNPRLEERQAGGGPEICPERAGAGMPERPARTAS